MDDQRSAKPLGDVWSETGLYPSKVTSWSETGLLVCLASMLLRSTSTKSWGPALWPRGGMPVTNIFCIGLYGV